MHRNTLESVCDARDQSYRYVKRNERCTQTIRTSWIQESIGSRLKFKDLLTVAYDVFKPMVVDFPWIANQFQFSEPLRFGFDTTSTTNKEK